MQDPIKRYRTQGKVYAIPEKESKAFLADYPDAEEVAAYTVGEKKYNIPIGEVDAFLKDMPDAVPVGGVKKKEPTEPSSKPSVQGPSGSAKFGATGSGKGFRFVQGKLTPPEPSVPTTGDVATLVGEFGAGPKEGFGEATEKPQLTSFESIPFLTGLQAKETESGAQITEAILQSPQVRSNTQEVRLGTANPDFVAATNYLSYLKSTDPDRVKRMEADPKYKELFTGEKPQEVGDMALRDKAMAEFMTEARNNQIEASSFDLEKKVSEKGLKWFSTDMLPIDYAKAELIKQYNEFEANRDNLTEAQKAKTVNHLVERTAYVENWEKSIMDKYGVTYDELDEIKGEQKALSDLLIQSKDFSDFPIYEAIKAIGDKKVAEREETLAAQEEVLKNSGLIYPNVLMEHVALPVLDRLGTYGRGIAIDLPKVMSDAFGFDESYGWTDKAWDIAELSTDITKPQSGVLPSLQKPLYSDEGTNWRSLPSKLSAAGADLAVMASSGGALGSTGIFTSAFVGQVGDNYRDALAAGMAPQDAAQIASLISAVSGLSETVIPDNKLVSGALRDWKGSLFRELAGGLAKKGKKEIMKVARDSFETTLVKNGLKEAFEEGFETMTGDFTKETVNRMSGKDYYDTFDGAAYGEALTIGFLTGAIASGAGYTKPLAPSEAAAIANVPPEVVATMSEEDQGKVKELQEMVVPVYEATEGLPDETRGVVTSLQVELNRLTEAQGELAAPNPVTEERIAAIEVAMKDLMAPPVEEGVVEEPVKETAEIVTDEGGDVKEVAESVQEVEIPPTELPPAVAAQEVEAPQVEVKLVKPEEYEKVGIEEIDEADTPEKLAKLYRDEQRDPQRISAIDRAIADVGIKTTKESYARFGDLNNVTAGFAKAYFAKKDSGRKTLTIDQIAQAASYAINPDGDGTDVTPEDVVALMEANPNGFDPSQPRSNPFLKEVALKYKAITGKNINKRAAEALVEKAKLAEKDKEIADRLNNLDQEVGAIMNDVGSIDAIIQLMDTDEGYFTQFPFGYTKEEFNALKQFINENREQLKEQFEGTPELDEDGEFDGQDQRDDEPSAAEKEFNEARSEIEDRLKEAKAARRKKAESLSDQNLLFNEKAQDELFEVDRDQSPEGVARIMKPFDEAVEKAQKELDDFDARKDKFIKDAKKREEAQQKIEGEERAGDQIRNLKFKGLNADAFGIAVPLWNGLIETVATLVDAYVAGKLTAQELREKIKQAVDELKGKEAKFKADEAMKFIDEKLGKAIPEMAEEEPKPEGEKEMKQKAVIGRVYEGETRQGLRDLAVELGLDYEVEKQVDARAAAKKMLDKGGPEGVIQAVQEAAVSGGSAAYLLTQAIDQVERQLLSAKTDEERSRLGQLEADLFKELDKKARESGRFNSALNDAYARSEVGYRLSNKIQEWERITGETIPEDVKKRFEEYDRQLTEARAKLQEAEDRAREAEEKAAIENIQEDISRNTQRKKPTRTELYKKLADKVRKGKLTRPDIFSSSIATAIFDGAVETAAQIIQRTGVIADAIAAAIEQIKESDWYKSLSDYDRKKARDGIRDYVRSMTGTIVEVTNGKLRIPTALIREVVGSGVTNMEDVAEIIKEEIKDTYPDVTNRDIREAITNYGKTVNPTKDELARQVALMKRIDRLLLQLEDARNGKRRAKGKALTKLTNQEKELRRQIRIAEQELPVSDEEITRHNTENLNRAKERAKERIAELQRRLRERDFSQKKKPTKTVADKELKDLRAQVFHWKNQYDTELHREQLKNRGLRQKVLDFVAEGMGITRALMATGEISFILIQGGLLTISHPVHAARAFVKSMQHMFSEKRAAAWGNMIKSLPLYDEMVQNKLALSEYDARLTAREEQFLGGYVHLVWDIALMPTRILGKRVYEYLKSASPTKALERAGVGYLNTLRILRYMDGRKMLDLQGKTMESNPEDYKNLADVINTFTGRSRLGVFEPIARFLPTLFFSPRNWASILKQTTPYTFFWLGRMHSQGDKWYKPSVAQKVAMRDYMTFVATTGGIMMMIAAYLNDDDDDETSVELDPRSTDFMKIRLGDTRIDPWGGRIQHIILQSRLIMESINKEAYKDANTGELYHLGERKESGGSIPTSLGLLWNMTRNKLAPTMGIAVNRGLTHRENGERVDEFGNTYTWDDEVDNLYPMYWATVKEINQEDPDLVGAFLTTYAFFGGGVSVYGTKEERVEKLVDRMSRKYRKEKGVAEVPEDVLKTIKEEAVVEIEKKMAEEKVQREMNAIGYDEEEYKNRVREAYAKEMADTGEEGIPVDRAADIREKVREDYIKQLKSK